MNASPHRHDRFSTRRLAFLTLTLVSLGAIFAGGVPARADALTEANRHYRTGLAYERLGRLDQAYTELQLAANLNPSNAAMALAVGTVASHLGRWDEAQRALEHSIALDAASCASYYELALVYESKNMDDRSLENWHRFTLLALDDTLKAVARKHIAHLETHL
ncbi:MAG TPA: hypothetical protein VMU17_04795 [Elusimicrobiota bacterium]|nr:hypothetical protein [Elusimicrobiota bacterium]